MADRTKGDILHIATLARLALREDETETRLREFNDIVKYFEKLNELSTDDIEPTFQIMAHGKSRQTSPQKDEPVPSLESNKALSNAPERQDSFFVVPRVIEDEGK